MAGPSWERPAGRGEFGHRLSARLARAALRPGGPALESRSVGNALLVHPRGFVDGRALTFAQGLAADPQHTLVVLDLPASPPEAVRETVARALDRRGSSFRLVPGRGSREDVKLTAQWLADRLGRLVLAPDGATLRAAGGALFVPADHGTGWLSYRPNLPSLPDSRRFPKPRWEFAIPDQPRPVGAGGMVEPLPGGVWIRGTWEDATANSPVHRQRLVDLLVGHPDLIAVAVGSPGTSALPLEEIAAFWDALPTSVRPLVRFIPYGPVAVPDGAPLGQALADLLGQRVAVYAGIPAPGADGGPPEVRTLQRNGTLGWRPYADEFGFVPRAHTGGQVMPPVVLNSRHPMDAIPAVGPGVYEYAPDVVVEVVQSGLWVRPPSEPRDGHAVRAASADPAYPALLYDDNDPAAADRMRFMAYELLRGLDPSFSRRSRIIPASEAGRVFEGGYAPPSPGGAAAAAEWGPGFAAPGPAGGRVLADPAVPQESLPQAAGDRGTWTDHGPVLAPGLDPVAAPGAQTGTDAGRSRWESPAPRPAGPLTSEPEPGRTGWQPPALSAARPVPGPDLSTTPPAPTSRAVAQEAAGAVRPSAPPPAAPPWPGPVDPPSAGPGAAEQRGPGAAPEPERGAPERPGPVGPAWPGPVAPPSAGPGTSAPTPQGPPQAPQPTPPIAAPPSAAAPPVAPTPPIGVPPTVLPAAAAPPTVLPAAATPSAPATPPGAPRIRLESSTPAPQPPAGAGRGPGGGGPAYSAGPRREPAAAAAAPSGPGPGRGGVLRVQTEPEPAASVVVSPQKGISREREWLRRSLGERYDTAAAFASRVLSESPGLQGGSRSSAGDALTDMAAVRLYLTGATQTIDAAIRSGTAGPHVPLARCAAGGLRRLPSHRGAAMLRATLSAAERAWYREGRVVREHSFLAALSTVRQGLPGNTDIVIWSLTARRTALLVAEIADRVLFAPGTAFKVLRVVDGGRPAVLLRELSASELDEHGRADDGRVPLDEISLAGLEQFHTFWQAAENTPDVRAGEPLPAEYADAFSAPPGLLQDPPNTPDGPRRPASVDGTLPQRGAKP